MAFMSTTVALVGSTGSIGRQAVDVVRAAPGRFEVVALGALVINAIRPHAS